MPKHFDEALSELKSRILLMAATAERMIDESIRAIMNWDLNGFESLNEAEDRMDAFQREIDEETIRLISVFTPVAGNLRFLLMVTRINAELERIADQIMNISFYSRQMMQAKPIRPLVGIPNMAEKAQHMLKRAMDAFSERASEEAKEVIVYDDKVDRLHDQLFRELMTYVLGDPKTITQVLELILIARAYKRVADHAVAIAEDVVFMVEGEDIRHTEVRLSSTEANERSSQMGELNIQLCPETGICSIIKADGNKIDLMPDEVNELREAGGDARAIKNVIAQIDSGFADQLNGDDVAQMSKKIK